ncbi:Copia protein [Ceratocystis fimbriata CBS 114723]|uniref:Copia protein n=1 Tax=Ceratocystis fimbriata CBS 114723 TaxID=1035309 RepID=A0A2C5WYH5_9PEZI|nr:Copia protein [Ceratocystis fimbriata CBS 114723]
MLVRMRTLMIHKNIRLALWPEIAKSVAYLHNVVVSVETGMSPLARWHVALHATPYVHDICHLRTLGSRCVVRIPDAKLLQLRTNLSNDDVDVMRSWSKGVWRKSKKLSVETDERGHLVDTQASIEDMQLEMPAESTNKGGASAELTRLGDVTGMQDFPPVENSERQGRPPKARPLLPMTHDEVMAIIDHDSEEAELATWMTDYADHVCEVYAVKRSTKKILQQDPHVLGGGEAGNRDLEVIVSQKTHVQRILEKEQHSKYLQPPCEKHMQTSKRMLRYLVDKGDYGLRYRRPEGWAKGLPVPIIAYADASLQDEEVNGHSSWGFVVLMAGAPVSWASRRHKTAIPSTAESEYVAAYATGQHLRWIANFVHEAGFDGQIQLYGENEGALKIAHSKNTTTAARHFMIKVHSFREQVREGFLRYDYVDTANQLADIFTKALPAPAFQRLGGRMLHGLADKKKNETAEPAAV